MSDEEQEGARVLRGISFGRQIALSPYLFSCNRIGKGDPTYLEYIESSPKLQYVMGCIETVKEYHDSHDEEMSGQVIYMNAGIGFFPLIKDYLVHEVGFDSSEVAFIIGGMNAQKKDAIKDKFQSGKVKVLLGSQAIREGINLQNRATVLYDLWLDWNPTDLKQLEGRIWRFGNQFANVRIVIPLIENSIDVAIFQKLEEKTNRINEIWNRAGKENTLKLDEFNPAELKMGLITNPRILAEITLMEDKEILQDEITRLENQVAELDGIVQARNTFQNHIGAIEATVNMYKPLKEGQSPRTTETVLRIFKAFIDDPETSSRYIEEANFNTTRKAYQLLKRATERILEPRGLDIHFNQEVVLKRFQEEIEQNKENLELKTGNEAQAKLTKEIIEEREKSGYQPKPVIERVKEFASLNDKLLSERMIYEGDASISNRNERIQLSDDHDSTDDLLVEMEKLLKDTEEMEQLMNEMNELEQAA
jgi:superfamily II DNA/RNA helicase